MTSVRGTLGNRREEFDTHFGLAQALEDRLYTGDESSLGTTVLSVRHLLTMKSGLLVHLYNIEEAVMNEMIDLLGQAVGSAVPKDWSIMALREWLREHAVARLNGPKESQLDTIHSMSLKLLTTNPLGAQRLKKPSGTWSDKLIYKFATRLGVDFSLPPEMWRRVAESPKYGDRTPIEFLADRRNALAHGRRSFEEGASDLTLAEIREIADVTLDYLALAVDAFQRYADNSEYLAVNA